MYLKAFIFGAEGVGKTELNKHLCFPAYINTPEKKYFRSIAPDFNTREIPDIKGVEKALIQFWDTPGNLRFKSFSNLFYPATHFGLFCIDLSIPLDLQIINEIQNDIEEFRTANPDALLILVGTKSDIALSDALKTAQLKFAEYPFTAAVATSAREPDGSQALLDEIALKAAKLFQQLLLKEQKLALEMEQYKLEKNTIFHARNRCIVNSSLYLALDKLHHQAHTTLSPSQIKRLGQEANTLLDQFEDTHIPDKIPGIQAFITNCTTEIQGKNHALNNTLLTIAYTLTTAIIASLIGFAVGFALGAWSGPGAFFTGIAAGSASASAVVGFASVCGASVLAYSIYHFFKADPILSSVKEVAEKGCHSELILFNEGHIFNESSHL